MGRDVSARTPLRQRRNAYCSGRVAPETMRKEAPSSSLGEPRGRGETQIRITRENHKELLVVAGDTHLDVGCESPGVSTPALGQGPRALSWTHSTRTPSGAGAGVAISCRSTGHAQDLWPGSIILKGYGVWRFFWQ